MKYKITGANRETGKEIEITIDARDFRDAETQANDLGIMISEIREQGDVQRIDELAHAANAPIAPVYPQRVHAPTQQVRIDTRVTATRSNSLGIASLILGILAFLISWIPFVACVSLPISGLGLLLGIIGFILALTRTGFGIGFPIAGGAVSALAFAIAMVMGVWLTASTGNAMEEFSNELERQNAPSTTASSESQGTGATWHSAAEPVRIGDVEIEVLSVKVEVPRLIDMFGDEQTGENDQLVIHVAIRNLSEGAKIDYTTMRGGSFSFTNDMATLTDSFDNEYRRITYGTGSHPIDGVKNSASIYPGDQVKDVLVFEKPVDAATHLDLDLPCSNFGESGRITLRIDAEMIE